MRYTEHQARLKHHKEKFEDAKQNYIDAVNRNFQKEFGRKPEFGDYKVSGIWSDEFSKAAKDEIRNYLKEANENLAVVRLHNAMLKKADKVEAKFEKGGRILSAVKRDRAYKSQEPHEQSYKRVRNPKNPSYKKKAFETGGPVKEVDWQYLSEKHGWDDWQREGTVTKIEEIHDENPDRLFYLFTMNEGDFWLYWEGNEDRFDSREEAMAKIDSLKDNWNNKQSFATGGIVKTIPEGEEYRYKGSSSIDKDIYNKIAGQIANLKFAGNYYVYGQKDDAYLYELDEADKDYVSKRNQGKIKDDERVFRYYTRTTAIGGMVPLIKVNIVKGLLYYPIYDGDDRELTNFETKGVRPEYLNLVKAVSSFDHGGSVDEDHYAHAKQVGRESQDFTAEAKEYAGANWNKMSETEKQSLITEMQKDWDKGNRFAKGGSTSKEKRFAVYLSTEIHGENVDSPDYETNDFDAAVAWAKKKSAQSHPDEPKNYEYSDYYYAADVFDRVARKIVAEFYRGEADDFDKPQKVVDAKYYEKHEKNNLSDFFRERNIATFYSEKTGATNDMMKVVSAMNPNADMSVVESFISNEVHANSMNDDDHEYELAKWTIDNNYKPKESITYTEALAKLKSASAGKSFATQKAMQEALKLWFIKPVKGIEIKGVHFAKGGKVTTWGGSSGYSFGDTSLSFNKRDYTVDVNLKNLEVEVNITSNDSVNQYSLNDTGADWEQHRWGYVIKPENIDQLLSVLEVLKVQYSKKQITEIFEKQKITKKPRTKKKAK
jgi:hypothetical protein